MVDIKIKGNSVESAKPSLSGGPSAGTVARHEGATFPDTVKAASRKILDGELRAMLDQTRALGDVFLRGPDEAKLGKYKDAIREYLNKASKELFSLKQEFGPSQGNQQKVYQLIETVNQEIDSLTRETLQKDKALQLLGSLDDIRGLIMDIFT